MRRILAIAAILIGARLLFGNFLLTTAKRESFFFENLYTPVGLILIVTGAYLLWREYE